MVARIIPTIRVEPAPQAPIAWGTAMAIAMLGSFIFYLLAKDRLGVYLGFFSPSGGGEAASGISNTITASGSSNLGL